MTKIQGLAFTYPNGSCLTRERPWGTAGRLQNVPGLLLYDYGEDGEFLAGVWEEDRFVGYTAYHWEGVERVERPVKPGWLDNFTPESNRMGELGYPGRGVTLRYSVSVGGYYLILYALPPTMDLGDETRSVTTRLSS